MRRCREEVEEGVVVEVDKWLIVIVAFPLPEGRCRRKEQTKGETSCAAPSRERSSVDTSSGQMRWRMDMVMLRGGEVVEGGVEGGEEEQEGLRGG